MNMIKLSILLLSASECLTKIFKAKLNKVDDSTSLVEAAVEILSSCFEKEVTVGLAGNSDDILMEKLRSQQSHSVALIGSDTRNITLDDKNLRQQLQLFVVISSSSTKLEQTLDQIARSRWWNHMATYFILARGSPTTDHGCSSAFSFLWTAWNRNLLNALYICNDVTKGRLIYSFNPYTNKAPNPWQVENTFKTKKNNPWTLLRRNYDPDDKEICLNLEFDKTTDLSGYKIHSSVKELLPAMIIDEKKSGINRLQGRDGSYVASIYRALNASARLIEHDKRIPGMNDKLGIDMAMETVNGISDVVLMARWYSGVLNYTVSQFFSAAELSILTQSSGHQSQLNKLINLIDRSSRIGICFVALTTLIFFKFFLHQPIGSAVLNVCRIVTNSSLPKEPNNQAARFYLAGVFFLVVTIVGIYQGKLASLLTKAKALPDVETMRNLADSGFIIHGHKSYAYLFTDPVFKNRFIKHESFDCEQYVVHDPSAACIQLKFNLVGAATRFKLHVSRDPATRSFGVFVIRKDWPLEKRFNAVLETLFESGVTNRIIMEETLRVLSIAKFYESEEKKSKSEVMILSELTFSFAILGIGLGFSSLCFVLEVTVSRRVAALVQMY